MKYTLCKEADYKSGQWMGGTTKEMVIYPKTSSYLDRNFIWRLSSATIEREKSSFSKLPDYDRVIMVLEGEVVLSYEGQRVARLKALEQDRFDGAWKTDSFGKIKDYNLMVRKGSEGYLDIIFPENVNSEFTSTEKSSNPKAVHTLFCKDGYFVVTACGQSHMVHDGETFIMEYEKDEEVKYSIMGEGTIIRAQIFYDDMAGEVGPEIIPAEKATFDDFKLCIYLANVQFRWAKYIVKSLRITWFDEALSKAIKKAERFYLTSIVFLAGISAIGIYVASANASAAVCVAAIAAWVLIDCLLVSPLIYMVFMPKPIRKHIKDIDKLTPYEQRVREEELGRNEQVERIIKKYKNSGRNLGE